MRTQRTRRVTGAIALVVWIIAIVVFDSVVWGNHSIPDWFFIAAYFVTIAFGGLLFDWVGRGEQ